MLKKIFTLIFMLSLFSFNGQERCGTNTITEYLINSSPKYKVARDKSNIQTIEWIKNNQKTTKNSIINIPVVVHVVWNTDNPEQNISDAQIQYQIDVLNNDYRRQNIDQINTESAWLINAADCEIEFCLAKVDPNGLATNGIIRVETNHGTFDTDSDIHTSSSGGSNDWPNHDYLNLWVCNLGDNLLGYATPPSSSIQDGDGVVINYKNFGNSPNPPYNKGRTATHEIGHWLNLEHLWGSFGFCGDDQVNDTPKQESWTYNCPGFPSNPNSCSTANSNGDMFQNYMDYTNDACMNLFTNDQKTRMRAAISLYRPNMLNHNLCSELTNLLNFDIQNRKIVKIIDILGKEIKNPLSKSTSIYIYSDGSVEKIVTIK